MWKAQHGCEDCGESDPIVLELDHWEDNKEEAVGRLVTDGAGWSRLQAELDKCAVVCANCHRKRTASRRSQYACMPTGEEA